MTINKKYKFYAFGFLSLLIGLYPIIYLFIDNTVGLLENKTADLLSYLPWNIGFYTHISFGGLALFIGWTQFSQSLRAKYLKIHRLVGKVYVFSVIVSAITGFYVAFYATGGAVVSAGFMSLAVIWLFTTLLAFFLIRSGEVKKHQMMMVYSFAACFAAVTLRLWMPILMGIFGDFVSAYTIVAWLCWVPNMIVAYIITRRMKLS